MNTADETRRRFALRIACAAAAAVPTLSIAQGPSSAVNRVADRARRNLVRRHGIVSFTRATARQRAMAEAKARELQEQLRQEWQRKNRARAKATPAAQVPMRTVINDLNKPKVQAVRVEPSPGARDSVLAVDVEAAKVVSGNVVNSEIRINPRTDLSERVREAAQDPNVPGAAPAEFVNGNISLTAI